MANATQVVLAALAACLAKLPTIKSVGCLLEIGHADGHTESILLDTEGLIAALVAKPETIPMAKPTAPAKPKAAAAAAKPKAGDTKKNGGRRRFVKTLDFTKFVSLADSGLNPKVWLGLTVKRQSASTGNWCDYTIVGVRTSDTGPGGVPLKVAINGAWMDKGESFEAWTKYVLVSKELVIELTTNRAA